MKKSRRSFLKTLSSTSAILVTGGLTAASQPKIISLQPAVRSKKIVAPGDKIRIATIGMGIIGNYDTKSALQTGQAEIVAACDLYQGRLSRAKELFGKDLFITRDYREILNRKDIDAVLICTPDHWHSRIAIDALKAGKHVYCEKPMVHKPEQGLEVIAAQKKSGKVMQVGSQRVSSIAFIEAKKLYESGSIGKINMVEAKMNRHSSLGAWQYSVPPDASPATLDFDRFLGNAPKVDFDPVRFFRWRNYRDYGTGVPGDLFVHLISGLHFITGSLGPKRIFASGQLSFWKDGRDVPDVVSAVMEYPATDKHPAFMVSLQVNLADGSGDNSYTRIIGSDGVIELGWNDFKLKRSPLPKAPGYGGYDSLFTFAQSTQDDFVKQYNTKYNAADKEVKAPDDIIFKAPDDYDERTDHFRSFFASVRDGKPCIQDATFGLRAAGPCLATNLSIFQQKVINWDPISMKIV